MMKIRVTDVGTSGVRAVGCRGENTDSHQEPRAGLRGDGRAAHTGGAFYSGLDTSERGGEMAKGRLQTAPMSLV